MDLIGRDFLNAAGLYPGRDPAACWTWLLS